MFGKKNYLLIKSTFTHVKNHYSHAIILEVCTHNVIHISSICQILIIFYYYYYIFYDANNICNIIKKSWWHYIYKQHLIVSSSDILRCIKINGDCKKNKWTYSK